MKWMGKNARPACAGWYYTKNQRGSVSARYFDDSNGIWHFVTAHDGWTPNDSFTEWLNVPGVSDRQRS